MSDVAGKNKTTGHQLAQSEDAAPLDEVLSRPIRSSTVCREAEGRIDGIVIGNIVACTGEKGVLVDYPGNPAHEPCTAIVAAPVHESDIHREVALSFVGGDPRQPVVLGLVQHPGKQQNEVQEQGTDRVELDGETLVFNAQKEIVLRCGKASITLTRAGKILIKGTYTSTHSSGVNRLKGGSVQIN